MCVWGPQGVKIQVQCSSLEIYGEVGCFQRKRDVNGCILTSENMAALPGQRFQVTDHVDTCAETAELCCWVQSRSTLIPSFLLPSSKAIADLLRPESGPLALRENVFKECHVQGLSEYVVQNGAQHQQMFLFEAAVRIASCSEDVQMPWFQPLLCHCRRCHLTMPHAAATHGPRARCHENAQRLRMPVMVVVHNSLFLSVCSQGRNDAIAAGHRAAPRGCNGLQYPLQPLPCSVCCSRQGEGSNRLVPTQRTKCCRSSVPVYCMLRYMFCTHHLECRAIQSISVFL